MVKFWCRNCNYEFEPKDEKVPQLCPYCSKGGTIEKAREMQDWIDEVTSELGQR